jgi:hypothetical protein
MAGPTILDEYLVRLAFVSDSVGYAHFASALRDASSLVDNQFLHMAKRVLEFQGAVTGAFFSLGAAAVGIVDKVAMADQEYRLLALHMYTSLPVARSLKIALDALGQPLENVMWDPELAARFHQLVQDQQTLTQELGPNFENQMLKIRDVRFEFTRFGVELEYLSMMVVEDLAKAFGTTVDGLLQKMRGFNDWFITNMPSIAAWITTKLVPILQEVWSVLVDTGHAAEAGLVVFTNLVGLLSGDTSLEGTALSFDKVANAIQDCITMLSEFIKQITSTEVEFSHLIMAAVDIKNKDFKGAWSELSHVYDIEKAAPPSGPASVGAGFGKGILNWIDKLVYGASSSDDIQDIIAKTAAQQGVSPALALAVASQESGYRQFDSAGKVLLGKDAQGNTGHAMGVMQLEPGTAKAMGVDPYDAESNIWGGVKYLAQLLKKYGGNEQLALEHYYGSKDAAANASYARQVMQKESSINIDIKVYAAPGAQAKDIALEIDKVLAERLTRPNPAHNSKIQRNIAEFNSPAWGYP